LSGTLSAPIYHDARAANEAQHPVAANPTAAEDVSNENDAQVPANPAELNQYETIVDAG